MSMSLLLGFLLFLPLAIIFILLSLALIFLGVVLYKRGNKSLAVILFVADLFPIVISLIFIVSLIVAVLDSFGLIGFFIL